MKTIDIETLRLMFRIDPEKGHLFCRSKSAEAGHMSGDGYRMVKISGKRFACHRILWTLHFGKWPDNEIDHINGNRIDNRISNLRDVPRLENARNVKRFCTNTIGFVGVYFNSHARKWHCQIREGGKNKHIGLFATKEEAVCARRSAEVRLGFHPNHGRP